MVAGAVAGQAAKAAAGKTASGASKAAGKAAPKGASHGILTPNQEAGIFLNRNEQPSEQEDKNSTEESSEKRMNYTGSNGLSNRFSSITPKKNQGNSSSIISKLKNPKKIKSLIAIAIPLIMIILCGTFFAAPVFLGTLSENGSFSDIPISVVISFLKMLIAGMLENGSLPSTLAEKLAESGIEVGYLDSNNNFIAGLRPSPEDTIVFANSSNIDSSSQQDTSLVLRFNGKIIDSNSFIYFAENDPKFHSAVSNTINAKEVAYFDKDAEDFFSSKINYSRNIYAGYTSGDTKDYREIASQHDTTTQTSNYDIIDSRCYKNDGTKDMSINGCKTMSGSNSLNIESDEQKAEAINAYLDQVYVNTLVDCDSTTDESDLNICDNVQASIITYLVNSVLNANEMQESMRFFLSAQEIVSKTKAGDGSSAPINELLNYLTTPDENGISAVQSPTLSSVLTKSFSGYSAEEAKKYSLDRSQNAANVASLQTNASAALIASLTTTATELATGTHKSTSMLKVLEEVEDPGEEPQPPDDPTNKIKKAQEQCDQEKTEDNPNPKSCELPGKLQKEYEEDYATYKTNHDDWQFQKDAYDKYQEYADKNNGKHPSTLKVMGELSNILSSKETTVFNKNKYNSIIGAHAGELFAKGGSIIESKISTYTMGGTPGTKEKIAAYQKEIDRTLAIEEKMDRLERTPFDISSQNTFLGSIVHGFASYLYTTPSISSISTTFSSMFRQSFSNILPGVFADNQASFYTTYGECQESQSKFACSVYSNPTVIFDLGALSSVDIDSLTEPDENSSMFINERLVNTGYTSYEIAEKIWEDKSVFDKATGFFNQFKEFSKNKIKQFYNDTSREKDYFSTYYNRFSDEELAVITGEAFVADGDNDNLTNYQAFIINDRILAAMDYYSKANTNKIQYAKAFIPGTGQSSYIASLQNSNKKLEDLSDAEYIAKISGLSTKEANIALGYIAYNSYLASIDHDSALAFGKEETFDFETSIQSEDTTQFAIFNSSARKIHNLSRKKEVAYVA